MELYRNEFYDIAMHSDIGERKDNQDAVGCLTDEGQAALALCDGMGGFEDGGRASRFAVDEFLRLYRQREPFEAGMNIKDFLVYVMDFADGKIAHFKNARGEAVRAGTTCIYVLLHGREMYCLSAGDSRLYIVRNGKIKQLTRDHTVSLMAKQNYARGKISYEEYAASVTDNKTICSYLGFNGIEIFDVNDEAYRLKKGDMLLLATDGLYRSLDSEAMESIMSKSSSPELLVRRLISTAVKNGNGKNQDNASAIVCAIK
ncbi:MAG: serine/threonine-protein phosphatase [Butyrivibrio sp.]|nr:serine/threonine-protein phosphatase [Butyrivibrio sp.]